MVAGRRPTDVRPRQMRILLGYWLLDDQWGRLCDWFNTLQWRHNRRDTVSNHQPHDGLFNWIFRRRSQKTSKLRVTGLCAGKSPGTGDFPAQRTSNVENVSTWWRHHEIIHFYRITGRLWLLVLYTCLFFYYPMIPQCAIVSYIFSCAFLFFSHTTV